MDNKEERLKKLRQKVHKIAKGLKEFIPEISGAAIGAAFGNPVVGAVVGSAAKKLLEAFIKAKSKPSNLDEAMKQNIERFSNCTIVASGTTKKKTPEPEMYQLNAEDLKNFNCTLSPQEIANKMFKNNFTR